MKFISPRILSATFKWSVIVLVGFLFVVAAEFGQYIKSVQDVRYNTIAKWASDNPMQKPLAQEFINVCIKSKPDKNLNLTWNSVISKQPISVYDCGARIGASGLVKAVKLSDKILVSAAWPLSIIANTKDREPTQ